MRRLNTRIHTAREMGFAFPHARFGHIVLISKNYCKRVRPGLREKRMPCPIQAEYKEGRSDATECDSENPLHLLCSATMGTIS